MNNQRGSVLIISLILLMVLSLIGITSMRTTILEEKMAGNMLDREIAFQAAEAALRDGEEMLQNGVDTSLFNGSNGRLGPDDTPNFFDPVTWSSTNSIEYSGTVPGVIVQPRYVIQYIPYTNTTTTGHGNNANTQTSTVEYFKVTARGIGKTNNSTVMVQSFFKPGTGRTAWNEPTQ